MPDLDTGVIDLCRHTPRKRKSKTRPLHHMTSMPPNRVPRRTQDKRQTNRSCASEFSHSYEFNSTAHALKLCCGERSPELSLVDFRLKEACTCFTSPIDARCKKKAPDVPGLSRS